MMEKSLERIEQEIKDLKASMPVSGSLVETYFISQTFIKTLPNKAAYSFTITFTPYPGYEKAGINTLSMYIEDWASGPYTSQFNPYSFTCYSNESQRNDGVIISTHSGTAYFYDGDTFEERITVCAYGTVPGTLSIEWA